MGASVESTTPRRQVQPVYRGPLSSNADRRLPLRASLPLAPSFRMSVFWHDSDEPITARQARLLGWISQRDSAPEMARLTPSGPSGRNQAISKIGTVAFARRYVRSAAVSMTLRGFLPPAPGKGSTTEL